MRILALVPARNGSRRLPGKNIKPLCGKPLLVWSIDAVRGIPDVCDVLVSTDDAEAAAIARAEGALVPWLRPAQLATDDAASIDVALHALDWYERDRGRVDGLLLLQPTSPFRTRATVLRALDLFAERDRRCVVAVSPAKMRPSWFFHVKEDTLRACVPREGPEWDAQPLVAVNGALYLCSPQHLRNARQFVDDDAVPLIIESPEQTVDIDTAWDWEIAEMVARRWLGE
jgi:CMP-N,N'-diacetyllegionaminic acid synthase